MADHQLDLFGFGRGQNSVGFIERRRDRFFDQEMFSRVYSLQGDVAMIGGCDGDRNRLAGVNQ